MSQKSQEIDALIAPAVAALGLELLGSEWNAGPSSSLLRLYIDAPGRTVTLDDCEATSREVEALLDVHDPIKGQYTLEVSSPGIDRPLFTAQQVARHPGETAKVTLKLPMDGRRRLQGRILRVEGEDIVLEVDGNELVLPFDAVEKARIVPDLVALGLAPKSPKPAGGRKRKPS